MRIRDLNWMQLESCLRCDDRIVLPVGSTEQHAYLSLETDNILAEHADFDHASWSENFPWTRLPEVEMPAGRKAPVEWPEDGNPATWREALGDGSFGGLYQRSADDERRLWMPRSHRSVRGSQPGRRRRLRPGRSARREFEPPFAFAGRSLAQERTAV
jgi:hypothetical protein